MREANAGVAFDSPVDIGELLANPPVLDNGWRARSPRVEVDRLGTLRSGALTLPVTIRDISQSGAKLECDEELELNSDIVITPENLRPLAGVVRWQNGGTCGVSFNGLIPLRELIDWIKAKG